MVKNSKKIKDGEKEIKEAKRAVKKAKKGIREAEEVTTDAQVEVVEAAEIVKGKRKKSFVGAARDLEKAIDSVAESCEATEEAEFKIKNPEE
jgi:wobble nucleotide-excising tRNase